MRLSPMGGERLLDGFRVRVVPQIEIHCAECAKQTRMSDVGGKVDVVCQGLSGPFIAITRLTPPGASDASWMLLGICLCADDQLCVAPTTGT